MAEKLAEVVADLEKLKTWEKVMYRDLKESGLSFEAQKVLRKLKGADPSVGWHRVYQDANGQIEIEDVLTDAELIERGYTPGQQCKHIAGESPARRDVVTYHNTSMDEYEDLWIGEALL